MPILTEPYIVTCFQIYYMLVVDSLILFCRQSLRGLKSPFLNTLLRLPKPYKAVAYLTGMQSDPWAATALWDLVFQIFLQASSQSSFFTVPSWRTPFPKSSEKTPVRPTARKVAHHRRRPRTSATGWVRGELCLGSANNWATTPWSVGCLALLSWSSRRSCQGDFTPRYTQSRNTSVSK